MARLDTEPLGQVTLVGRLASARAHERPPILSRASSWPGEPHRVVSPPPAGVPREHLHFLLGQSTMGSRPAQVTIRAECVNRGQDSIFPVSRRLTLPRK